tara:strand:+ start:698 stop:1087 length:390 start_codon:yes stop_codon:yes gene_type:complete
MPTDKVNRYEPSSCRVMIKDNSTKQLMDAKLVAERLNNMEQKHIDDQNIIKNYSDHHYKSFMDLDEKDNEIIELKKRIGILERIIIDQQKIYIHNAESIEESDEERIKMIVKESHWAKAKERFANRGMV